MGVSAEKRSQEWLVVSRLLNCPVNLIVLRLPWGHKLERV
jgi:hypothetical protein